MFTRSRRNLAYWFALSMGGILVLFAGVSYCLSVEGQLQAFDQALSKKSRAIASGATVRFQQGQWQIEPDDAPWMGSDRLSRSSELVYVRWYNTRGYLVRFIGLPAPLRLKPVSEFQTIVVADDQAGTTATGLWLRQATLPVLQNQQLVGYLQVGEPLTGIRDGLERVRLFLALGVPMTLGVIGVTGWFLGGVAMQPTRRAYDQLQRFTADASHELRAPLAAMLSNAQVGLLSPDDSAQQRLRLEKIVAAAKSMGALISNLLFLSRQEGPLDAASLKQVDLVVMLRSLIDDQTTQVTAQGLTFTSQLPAQAVILNADPDLLRQAVMNLLSNAFKYTSPGGSVQLRLSTSSRFAVIQVEDNGIGIPAADLPHIFERFYRVDTARSRQTGGFGLGLAIAQQIIAAHRGRITASSALEAGSTFQIELPLKG
ncbi:sensor histidine kinase [Stenomitos frigidus]|uniref:histidine kinase n=1 Tax=Stenomitos frigidus ULC18 TaxID=2107698 RepID=A0A2T1ECM0_9CYAN|nr:ATP-binding protein [Stenomitos frigidus]PSB30433.1 two-component sensor histidine kinase [Stenomitos frigidus ULC18]